jgi:hypothetical protein
VPDLELPFDESPIDDDGDPAAARIEHDRVALEGVRQSLVDAGFYAYGRYDEQNRWSVAVDDEAGRADVRIGDDGYEVELWASSPGLYADEENEWRAKSRARLVRMQLPGIARGFLEPHQHVEWDEVDEGIAVTEVYQLPFTRTADVGAFVRSHLPALEDLLARIESQLG